MAAMLTKQQAQSMLKAIGFDNARSNFPVAVRGFQTGWNLGPALAVDGDFGPKTSDALRKSFARHTQHKSTMSAHFSYIEFRCKGAAIPECRRIWVLRAHVRRLEAYRANIGRPVEIVSGCRCRQRNAQVGGAKSSQHLFGAASDVRPLTPLQTRINMKLFAGLGFQQSSGKVVHCDSRDRSGHNTTGGTPANPTTWKYAS
jgi:zinc D-Ala-D-Ala carboxypeptidase